MEHLDQLRLEELEHLDDGLIDPAGALAAAHDEQGESVRLKAEVFASSCWLGKFAQRGAYGRSDDFRLRSKMLGASIPAAEGRSEESLAFSRLARPGIALDSWIIPTQPLTFAAMSGAVEVKPPIPSTVSASISLISSRERFSPWRSLPRNGHIFGDQGLGMAKLGSCSKRRCG